MGFQIIYERGTLSQNTMKILNGMLPSAIKEPLQKEIQFWPATKILEVRSSLKVNVSLSGFVFLLVNMSL